MKNKNINKISFGCINKSLTIDKYIIVSDYRSDFVLFRTLKSQYPLQSTINDYNNLAKYKLNFEQVLIISYSKEALTKFLQRKKIRRVKVVNLFNWLENQEHQFIVPPSPLLKSR